MDWNDNRIIFEIVKSVASICRIHRQAEKEMANK